MKKGLLLKITSLTLGIVMALGVGAVASQMDSTTEVRAEGETWTLVTNASTLAAGDKVIIAAKDYDYALSTTQNSNNRGQASITKSDETASFDSDVQVLTLEAGTTNDTYAFNTGSGYLYAASSSKNYLRTETNLSDNSSWDITIASTGVATVKAKGSNTRNWLRYNSTNNPPIFSCYGSGQADICLYKFVATSVEPDIPEESEPTTYTVTYNANGATSGTVPTDSNQYENNATVTVLGNTGTLAKTGYVWSGWNTVDDGSGTDIAAGKTFKISDNTILYAKWTADTLNSLSISGSMTKTSYKDGDSWNPAGFTVTANYQSGATPDVTNDVTWSYYVGGDVQATAAEGDTSVVVRATYGGKYVESLEQTISVTSGVTYDLTTISDFSSWTTTYSSHSLTEASFSPVVGTAASLDFLITNKQGSGIGSEYPCIGAKTNSETTCLTFTLNQSGKKITSVDITFVTRYTSTYPSLYLHKGSGIATKAINSLTMSGSQGTELSLSCENLNDTVFTVGYNANQTSKNGAVGIKSISIGLADQASFGTLDHISITGLPNVVYHVGETYDPTGFAVTAFDGADESTANFKDVTASVVQLLDDTYTFQDSDVPGFDDEVKYTEGGKTVSDTYHVYVYALAEYQLVTSEPANWSGQYLIVGTNSSSELGAMNGGLSNPDVEGGYKVVTDTNGVIEAGQELEWTITSYSTGYSIQGKSGKYIGSLTTNDNGMLVSDTALVNTLSYSDDDGATVIAGSNSNKYQLTLNTAGDRFRYYASGTVQLYKLVESDNADAYAQTFLGAFTCDATGENEPTFAIKEGSTYWSWSLLATEYDTLTSVEKEQFRLGVASESGSNIEQALARYDYIVAKYGTSKYSNFMNRTITPLSSSRSALASVISNNETSVMLIVVMSSI